MDRLLSLRSHSTARIGELTTEWKKFEALVILSSMLGHCHVLIADINDNMLAGVGLATKR
jgi:hypothetical protein